MAQSGQVKLNDELHEIDGKPVINLLPDKVESCQHILDRRLI